MEFIVFKPFLLLFPNLPFIQLILTIGWQQGLILVG